MTPADIRAQIERKRQEHDQARRDMEREREARERAEAIIHAAR